jgi:hypothetical protein
MTEADPNQLWTENCEILFKFWTEIIPFGWMTNKRKANALTRLAFVIGIGLFINRLRGGDGDSAVIMSASLVALIFAIIICARKKKNLIENYTSKNMDEDTGVDPVAPPIETDDTTEYIDEVIDQHGQQYNRATSDIVLDPTKTDLRWLAGADNHDDLDRTLNR